MMNKLVAILTILLFFSCDSITKSENDQMQSSTLSNRASMHGIHGKSGCRPGDFQHTYTVSYPNASNHKFTAFQIKDPNGNYLTKGTDFEYDGYEDWMKVRFNKKYRNGQYIEGTYVIIVTVKYQDDSTAMYFKPVSVFKNPRGN